MLEPGDDLGLALEAHQEAGIFAERRMQHLERHVAVERRVVGFVNRRHAPLPKLFDTRYAPTVSPDAKGIRPPGGFKGGRPCGRPPDLGLS
jgi:hypothetical protein